MADVVWKAGLPGIADDSIVKVSITILPPWADMRENSEAAVNEIVEDYFAHEGGWDATVGANDDRVKIVVTVLAPKTIAGKYSVEVTRIAKAKARRI
jgi:hypothetical protein